MTTHSPNQNPDPMLTAFADGELDGEQNLLVLKRLAQEPALAERIAGQQRLRKAVGRVMDGPQYKAPAALRDTLVRMSREEAPAEDRDPAAAPRRSDAGPSVLARIGRWLPAAVAALFFIGALVALNHANNRDGGRLITAANVLNASLVDQFGNRHFKCSRDITPVHGTDRLPQDLAALPGALSDYFHQPIDPQVLDLSALGYEFDVAGLCLLPGKGAVHLIYKSQPASGHSDMLSLWMRPFQEGSGIEPDRLYTTADPENHFPMVVWRHGNMVYYLVGDTYDTVERAFKAISDNRG